MGRITLGQGQRVDAIINALRGRHDVPKDLITRIENGLKSQEQGAYLPDESQQPPKPKGVNDNTQTQNKIIMTKRSYIRIYLTKI